jgi:uncharacterized SAM-binding protein YcdF (DUF218 family)
MAELIYRGGKILWLLAEPGHLLLLWLVVGTLLLFAVNPTWQRLGRQVVLMGVVAGIFIAAVPIGVWGMTVLENRFPRPVLPLNVAGIIVIGGNEDEEVAATRGVDYAGFGTMGRELAFRTLADQYPSAMLIYAGGSSHSDGLRTIRQADIAKSVLTQMGLHREVQYERESRTTYENAFYAAKIAGDKIHQPWILITSAWHLPRAVGTFRQQGWNVIPMPVDYQTVGDGGAWLRLNFTGNMWALYSVTRETLGLVCYWLVGRSDALFPRPL